LKDEADGNWTIAIKPTSAAYAWNGSATLKGRGDVVIQVDPAVSGLASATFTHGGTSNFAIQSYAHDGSSDLLVDEIGHYSGEVQVPDCTFLVTITADGAWTAKLTR
jgi:hypothetical protein